jgi:hypothetical protein
VAILQPVGKVARSVGSGWTALVGLGWVGLVGLGSREREMRSPSGDVRLPGLVWCQRSERLEDGSGGLAPALSGRGKCDRASYYKN